MSFDSICYNGIVGRYFIEKNIHLQPLEIARRAVELASEKQAEDIILMDVRQACSFTDYIIICSGETDRQLDAIRREVADALKKDYIDPYKIEGEPESGWILLDYVDIVIHIFSQEMRHYYHLESIYEKAPQLIRIQ